MKLIFLGPPGSGKGTYASRISPKLEIPTISTGDIFREHMKNNTEIGQKIKKVMESGELVPDEIVMEVIKKRLDEDDVKNGFIFDGFPRTLEQAKQFDEIAEVDAVINIVVPDDIVIKRLTSRRQCEKCGQIYNILYLKTKQEGICDKCGGKLYQRKDDTIEVIKQRLEVYKKQTEPLIDYYKQKGKIIDIVNDDINMPPEPVVERILDKLKNVQIK